VANAAINWGKQFKNVDSYFDTLGLVVDGAANAEKHWKLVDAIKSKPEDSIFLGSKPKTSSYGVAMDWFKKYQVVPYISVFARVKEPTGGAFFGSDAQQEQFARISNITMWWEHKQSYEDIQNIEVNGEWTAKSHVLPLVYVDEKQPERNTRQGRREFGSWSFHPDDQKKIRGGRFVAPTTTIFKKERVFTLLPPEERTEIYPVYIAAPDFRELQDKANIGDKWESYNYDLRIPYLTSPWYKESDENLDDDVDSKKTVFRNAVLVAKNVLNNGDCTKQDFTMETSRMDQNLKNTITTQLGLSCFVPYPVMLVAQIENHLDAMLIHHKTGYEKENKLLSKDSKDKGEKKDEPQLGPSAVLGAVGCGVFGNPHIMVAEAFKIAFLQDNRKEKFDRIQLALFEDNGIPLYEVLKEMSNDVEEAEKNDKTREEEIGKSIDFFYQISKKDNIDGFKRWIGEYEKNVETKIEEKDIKGKKDKVTTIKDKVKLTKEEALYLFMKNEWKIL